MGTLTIRNLDDTVKAKLRLAAAARGVSMEEEARRRLKESVNAPQPGPKTIKAEDLLKFGSKPAVPFDQKPAFDEMWDEILDSHSH